MGFLTDCTFLRRTSKNDSSNDNKNNSNNNTFKKLFCKLMDSFRLLLWKNHNPKANVKFSCSHNINAFNHFLSIINWHMKKIIILKGYIELKHFFSTKRIIYTFLKAIKRIIFWSIFLEGNINFHKTNSVFIMFISQTLW